MAILLIQPLKWRAPITDPISSLDSVGIVPAVPIDGVALSADSEKLLALYEKAARCTPAALPFDTSMLACDTPDDDTSSEVPAADALRTMPEASPVPVPSLMHMTAGADEGRAAQLCSNST